MKTQNKLTRFSLSLVISSVLVVVLGLVFALYVRAHGQLNRAKQLRLQSFVLADELRQSSDDLTRMARTYAITGDPVYKQRYQDILDIRSGAKPRPENYLRFSWDLGSPESPPFPPPVSEAIGHLDRMRRAGFTEDELSKLAMAKSESDSLTGLEFEAMMLAESTGPEAEASREKARLMLHDQTYFRAKASIMKSVDEFYGLMDQRTNVLVHDAEAHASRLLRGFALISFVLIYTLWRTYRALRRSLGGSLDQVCAVINRIGKGDFASVVPLKAGLQDSVLGWLAATQDRLNESARERLRADAALRNSEIRKGAILAAALDAIITIDHQGRILEFNVAAEHLFGVSATEVAGREIAEVIVPSALRGRHRQGMARFLATGEGRILGQRLELPALRADGTEFPAELSITRVGTESPPVFTGFLRDITDRKQAEAALEESQGKYRTLVETSHDLIWSIDGEGRITFMNEASRSIFGREPEEMVGKSFAEFIPPEHLEKDMATFKAAMQTGQAEMGYVTRAYRKNGSVVILSANTRILRAADGRITGCTCNARDISESVRAQEIIERSEARFRGLFDQAAVGICLVSTEGNFLRTNRRFNEILGYSPEEMVQRNCIETTHPDDREREVKSVTQLLGGELQTAAWEKRYLRKDGQPVWCHLTLSLLSSDDRRKREFVGVVQDMTAQKQAETLRRESEEACSRLAAIVQSSDDAIISKTLGGVITSWNLGAERIFGYSALEAVGQPILMLIPPGLVDEEAKILSRIVRGESVDHFETRRMRKDGTLVDVSVRISPLTDHTGKIIGASKIGRDITARKQAEEELRASEERFRTMANSIPQLGWMANADGYITWYNQRWYEYTGTTPEQMEGWGWQSVHDPELLPRVMENWKAAIDSGKLFEMDFPLRRKDGEFRTFLTRVQPLRNPAGRVVQWFGTNTDVEELKRADLKIQQLNSGLEQRVLERTAQLQAANKELEAFSYSVSHDLRAPLRGVDGYIRILREDYADKLDAEGLRMIDVVSGEAKRMGQLIDDLLSFSRLGRQSMRSQTVDMTELAKEVFENLTRSAPESAPLVKFSTLPQTNGDSAMLRQVFVNLIGNAIKFTRHQPAPMIEIGSGELDGQQLYYVKDNGAGFDEKYSEKLFGVFQRLHSEAEFEGTGVGLALVQRVIHRHGGKIWAKGKPGAGAEFYFSLPPRREITNEHTN